jgi:hypothetical protein
MRLVDVDVRKAVPELCAVVPLERLIHDQAARHVRRRVQRARRVRVVVGMAEHLGPKSHRAGERVRLRVEKQLRRVEPKTRARSVTACSAVSVGLSRTYAGEKTVPLSLRAQ